MSQTRTRTIATTGTGTAILELTTDLPNGPYVTMEALVWKVFIAPTATVSDVKGAVERAVPKLLASQSQAPTGLHGNIRMRLDVIVRWTLNELTYKGGVVALTTSLEKMKSGDSLTFTYSSSVTMVNNVNTPRPSCSTMLAYAACVGVVRTGRALRVPRP